MAAELTMASAGAWRPLPEWVDATEWETRVAESRASALAVGGEDEAWREAVASISLRDQAGAFWCYRPDTWLRFDGRSWLPAGRPAGALAATLSPFVPSPPAAEAAPAAEALQPVEPPEPQADVVAAATGLSGLLEAFRATAVATRDCPSCGAPSPVGFPICGACGQDLAATDPAIVKAEPDAVLAPADEASGLLGAPVDPDARPLLDGLEEARPEDETVEAAPPAPCPACGAVGPGDAAFCRECGALFAGPELIPVAPGVPPVPAAVPAADLIACSACGASTPAAGHFCRHCGAPISARAAATGWACPACATANTPASRFCRHCGGPRPPAGGA